MELELPNDLILRNFKEIPKILGIKENWPAGFPKQNFNNCTSNCKKRLFQLLNLDRKFQIPPFQNTQK